MRQIEVFFDYECPFCKRGYEDLSRVLQENSGKQADFELIWRPCEAHPRPEAFPPHTDLCIQGFFMAQEKGVDMHAWNLRLFDAVHTDKIDVEDPETLANYVADLLNPVEFMTALEEGTYKGLQEQANIYAYEDNGVWFLPAFRSDGCALDAKGGIGVSADEIKEFLEL